MDEQTYDFIINLRGLHRIIYTTYGDTKPFIVITSGLFETLPDELIPTILAHECGHIACHHTEAAKVKEGNVISIMVNDSIEDGWYKRSSEVVIEYFEAKTEEEIALEHPGEIQIGESQKHFLGRNYEEVKEELKGLGFTNFVIKEMAMSKIGWGEKEEGVAKIIIDDKA